MEGEVWAGRVLHSLKQDGFKAGKQSCVLLQWVGWGVEGWTWGSYTWGLSFPDKREGTGGQLRGKDQGQTWGDQGRCGTTVWSTFPLTAMAIKGNGTFNSRKWYIFIYLDLALSQKKFQAAKWYISSVTEPLKGRKCNFPHFLGNKLIKGTWVEVKSEQLPSGTSSPATWQHSLYCGGFHIWALWKWTSVSKEERSPCGSSSLNLSLWRKKVGILNILTY